ncbi:MAG TPA: TonB-dependent receptor [Bryobacteraceae bacterium]|nr:TonB-dependent receptor [Bryobacteraceae bacterium]
MSACAFTAFAQGSGANAGTVRGLVVDPSGLAIPGATVTLQNPVSHYTGSAMTDQQGAFEIHNIPFNNYHATASSTGFRSASQDVDVRSVIPVQIKFSLAIGTAETTVNVEAGADLVETDPVTHTDIDRDLIEKLPLESASSQLSSLVTLSSPGIAADSNGLFHGLGDHAENSFSVDGQPITDQQSKIFSNQVPADAVQSLEVIEGAPPAEYGDKTSVVIVANTRSGLGVTTPHGNVTASYGTFGTSNEAFDISYGGKSWGNFFAVNGLNTGRFLDPPEFQVFHDKGNEENFWDHLDFKPSDNNSVALNLGFTRSWFQTPNSYDAQTADAWSGLVVDNGGIGPNGQLVGPADQHSQIRTFNIAPSWTRVLNNSTIFTFGGFARQDQFNYYPSADPYSDFIPNLQAESVGQNRRLTNLGLRASVTHTKGIHNLKAGITYEDTLLRENDTFGIVDPMLNAPCLNPDGSPFTDPTVNNPAECVGALTPNPNFVPLLGCIDLTRTAPLPGSDDCPTSIASPYTFLGRANVREVGMYVQDTITKNNWTFNVGIRGDIYKGLVTQTQPEPRLGISYRIKPSSTVLRVSYARTLETPFNENLVLASTGCDSAIVNALMSAVQGYPCLSSPVAPGWRNEFHAGLEQAFGKYLVIDGEYIWKYTHNAYDFSVFGNTPITYPIVWDKSKIPGFAIRASMPNFHGFSAYVVMSHVSARFFTPQIAGIGVTPISTGTESVFRIDHDEVFNQTAHLQYQPKPTWPWFSFTWRYDSGQVAGVVPCAGGNCFNGPAGTGTIVDASNLTPDQQFEAGLFCGTVHATPTSPISPNSLCPASLYGSTLLQIPAAGTENDDHNPPRIASRNLFDAAIGDDNIFHGDRYKWSFRVSVVNLTNQYALYNFLSTFSGTHYVTPRTVTATIGFHF